jgi:ligand-binding sensor domain-containing protein
MVTLAAPIAASLAAPFAGQFAVPLAAPLLAQSRDWRPQDRTVLGDFTRITAVAASVDRVYVTSPSGLLIWNPQFRQWEGPFTPPDPQLLDRVFAGLVDPLDNSLWLARTDGWVHYDPNIQLWDRGSSPAPVTDIAFDLDQPVAGLFLRTPSGWLLVSRGGISASPTQPPGRVLRPPAVADAIRANPSLQANASAILLDSHLRNARYTAAATGFGGRGWYLGTWGLGLLYLPDGAALPERLTFGLPGDAIGAVFAAPGGLWVANDRTATSDAGVSYVASDLSNFKWLRGPIATGAPFQQTRRLVGQGRALWAATDAGLIQITPDDERMTRYDEGRGLPDSRVLSLSARRGKLAVGTAHGVVLLEDSAQVTRVAPSFHDAALSVTISGDTVWVGTPLGLFAGLPKEPDLLQPEGLKGVSYQVPVVALGWAMDTLVALTADRMLWRNPKSGVWTLGPTLSAVLGRLSVLTPFRDGFYVGGERGFAFARVNSPPIRPLLQPGDLPGPVYDLAVDDTYLWVATPHGLVRFRLDAIQP